MDIEKDLNELRRQAAFGAIVNVLENKLISSGFLKNILYDRGLLTFHVVNEDINFYLCFWLEAVRFSFLIESNEISDGYLQTIREGEECAKFVNTILSNPVEITYVRRKKDNKLIKTIYRYALEQNGEVSIFKDEFSHSFGFLKLDTITEVKNATAIT